MCLIHLQSIIFYKASEQLFSELFNIENTSRYPHERDITINPSSVNKSWTALFRKFICRDSRRWLYKIIVPESSFWPNNANMSAGRNNHNLSTVHCYDNRSQIVVVDSPSHILTNDWCNKRFQEHIHQWKTAGICIFFVCNLILFRHMNQFNLLSEDRRTYEPISTKSSQQIGELMTEGDMICVSSMFLVL